VCSSDLSIQCSAISESSSGFIYRVFIPLTKVGNPPALGCGNP
jgi:hypothetical protein